MEDNQKEMESQMDVSPEGTRAQREATETWRENPERRTETGWEPMEN
jgi:hypothetical protein